MTLHALSFVHPLWLLGGLGFAAAILLLGARLDRKRRQALAAFSSRRTGPTSTLSRLRRAGKRGLLVLGAVLGCAALARPQLGSRWQEAHRRGLDLLFVLDTSKSMLAPDLKPDRLTRAKLAIHDLVAKFDGDRMGLLAFAGDAFLQCPLTLDRGIFEQTLDAVDTATIPRGGTDLGRAIAAARAALRNQPANRKLLVLLTDGEDLQSQAIAEARAAAADGIHIYTVGVGTPAGELIPLRGAPGRFVREEQGGFVRSRLDENTLQAVARVSGGDYRRLGEDGRGLERLYQDVLAKLPRDELASRMRQVPVERFQWPLGAAIACLALEPLLGERRRRRQVEEPAKHRPKLVPVRRRVAMVATLALAATGAPAQASPRDAERAYHQGHYQQSADEYARVLARSPDNTKLSYNLGVAAYKSGDFAKADDALRRSLRTERLDLQESAYYDLGNVLYRVGQKTVAQAPAQTKDKWQQAVAAYESALKLDPKDADAIFNRDFVKRRLAELERQQKQDQQNQQNQQQNQKNQQQKQGQQQQQGQQQKKPKPGQSKRGQGQPEAEKQSGQKDGQGAQSSSAQASSANQANPQNQAKPAKQESPQNQAKPASATPQAQSATQPPSAARGGAADHPDDARAEPEVPGKLSRNDARQLLDALRGDEKLMPMVPDGRQHAADDDTVRRDW